MAHVFAVRDINRHAILEASYRSVASRRGECSIGEIAQIKRAAPPGEARARVYGRRPCAAVKPD